jgi:hypothetical protein
MRFPCSILRLPARRTRMMGGLEDSQSGRQEASMLNNGVSYGFPRTMIGHLWWSGVTMMATVRIRRLRQVLLKAGFSGNLKC